MKKIEFGLALLLILTGCSLFEYHPYEVRLTEHNLNAKAYHHLKTNPAGDTIKFILIGDTQRFYDELTRMVNHANKQSYDFLIVAGDITEYGLQQEFVWVNDILKKLNRPYVAAVGNHDYAGEGVTVFKDMFGPLNDSFTYGDFTFILHDTNSREANYSGDVPNLDWLETQLQNTAEGKAIVVGHVPPFSNDFDHELEEDYSELLAEADVMLALYGHEHRYSQKKAYDDGVNYIVTPALDTDFYLMIKIWDNGYSIDKVDY